MFDLFRVLVVGVSSCVLFVWVEVFTAQSTYAHQLRCGHTSTDSSNGRLTDNKNASWITAVVVRWWKSKFELPEAPVIEVWNA